MSFTYQWIRHELRGGICTRCHQTFPTPVDGAFCLRVDQTTGLSDMQYEGALDWAQNCERPR